MRCGFSIGVGETAIWDSRVARRGVCVVDDSFEMVGWAGLVWRRTVERAIWDRWLSSVVGLLVRVGLVVEFRVGRRVSSLDDLAGWVSEGVVVEADVILVLAGAFLLTTGMEGVARRVLADEGEPLDAASVDGWFGLERRGADDVRATCVFGGEAGVEEDFEAEVVSDAGWRTGSDDRATESANFELSFFCSVVVDGDLFVEVDLLVTCWLDRG